MAHIHSVYDTDKHFVIDPITRAVKNTGDKIVIVQGDHNSERFTFEIPRTVEGHDMSTCNKVEVHYDNVDAAAPSVPHPNAYEVDDLQLSPADENVVVLSWLISADATRYVGKLNFSIKFMCDDGDGKPDYVWKTATHTAVSVVASQDSGETIDAECEDMLKTIEERVIENVSAGVDDKINEAVDKAVGVERKRIDELVAMRTSDGVTEYKFEGDKFRGIIASNGIDAYLWLEAFGLYSQTNSYYAGVFDIPLSLVPLADICVGDVGGTGLQLEISDATVDTDAGTATVSVTFNQSTEIEQDTEGLFRTFYPVAYPSIYEVTDARVGFDKDGNEVTYNNVGEAVRAAQSMALDAADLASGFDEDLARALREIEELKKNGGSVARIAYVDLPASGWQGEQSPYSQVVAVEGATENSQVDLTPSVDQLTVFHNKDLAFVTENEDGVVTVYAIGQKPTNDYTIQVTITEVVR